MGWVAVALVITALCVLAAVAKPPEGADPNSPMAQWYRGLKQNGSKASCCDIADCRPAEKVREAGDHRQVYFRGAWYDVPNEVVLPGQYNPTGEAVVCISFGRVLCFVDGLGA